MDFKKSVKDDIEEVEREIKKIIPGVPKAVYSMLPEYVFRGGKRIRPALLMLSFHAFGGKDRKSALRAAALLELFHNFCLSGDTLVATNPASKPISEVKAGDYVYSFDVDKRALKRNRVLAIAKNGEAEVFELKTRNRRITATANHPFLVARRAHPIHMRLSSEGREKIRAAAKANSISLGSISSCLALPPGSRNWWSSEKHLIPIKHRKSLEMFLGIKLVEAKHFGLCLAETASVPSIEWKPLHALRKGDLLVVLKNLPDDGKPFALPSIDARPNQKNSAKIPDFTDDDFCQLVGFFLGDGCVTMSPNGSRIFFCIPPGEVRDAYGNLFKRVFRKGMSSDRHNLVASSNAISQLFAALDLNKPAKQKRIPSWVFSLPRSQKLRLLRGLLDSDGTVNKKGHAVFSSASKMLVEDVKHLIDSLGFVSTHIRSKRVANRFKNARTLFSTIYEVEFGDPLKVLREIGSECTEHRRRLDRQQRKYAMEHKRDFHLGAMDFDHFALNPVLSIIPKGTAEVFDLQIEDSHNFVANNIVVHNSLIHDDIEDDSQFRRGKPTLHISYGIPIALNSGDALYTVVWNWLLGLEMPAEKKIQLASILGCAFQRVVEGQGIELGWHKNCKTDVAEEDYFTMVSGKTGALMGAACEAGAYLAGAEPQLREKFRTFGESLGVAFQIQDDILNVIGDFSKYKKKIGGDITEGKRTLMAIHAMAHADTGEKKKLQDILLSHTRDSKKIQYVISLFLKYDSVNYARVKARGFVEDASTFLEELPHSKECEALKRLADSMINREF